MQSLLWVSRKHWPNREKSKDFRWEESLRVHWRTSKTNNWLVCYTAIVRVSWRSVAWRHKKRLCNRLTVSRPWPEIVCYWSPTVVRDFLYEPYILKPCGCRLAFCLSRPPPLPRSDCSAKLWGLKLLIKWRLELSEISFSFKMECCAADGRLKVVIA